MINGCRGYYHHRTRVFRVNRVTNCFMELKKKRKPPAPLASSQYVWEGNDDFARKLNSHAEIGAAIQQGIFESGIEILSESGDEYVKIKTEYVLPDKNQFDLLEIIAKSLKS